MKSTVYIIKKLFMKVIALIVLSVLSVFNFIFHIFMVFYHLLAVPVAAFLILAMLINYIDVGFDPAQLLFVGVGLSVVGLKYILPILSPILEHWITFLKLYLLAPLIVRSPVKFTM